MKIFFSRPFIWSLIIIGLILALVLPRYIDNRGISPQRRVFTITAARYGYSPPRLIVNRGDTVVLKLTSADVTHGFLLDHYPVDLIIKQKGIVYQKYGWKDDNGKTHYDWDKVKEVEFTADKSGKFVFRCTQVCGSLHPFMTGELIVRPDAPYHRVLALSIWLVASLLLLAGSGSSFMPSRASKGINLLNHSRFLSWLVKRRGLQFALLLPMATIFYLFILSALGGTPVGNHNITIIFVWIFWWFLLKAVFVPLGGRLWCTVCPLPAPAEWLSRKALTAVRTIERPFRGLRHSFLGLQLDWPKRLQNMWLQNLVFMAMISFGIMLITRPIATGIAFLLILIVTIVLALIYRRRVFCLYICPVSGFLGTYSMASMTAVRAVDPEVCRTHKEKCCVQGNESGWGCPWGQYPGSMERNTHCGICTECFKSCPKDNVGLFLRPFASGGNLKGYDEMVNVIMMLTIAIAFSITMLGPWGFIRNAANVSETGNLPAFLTYIAILWSASLLFLPGFFLLSARSAKALTGNRIATKTLALASASMLIPAGIFSWIAFSLPSVMINYGYIFNVLSDPLGLDWNLFGLAQKHFPPLFPDWIPIIQGGLLLAGLVFGVRRGFRAMREHFESPRQAVIAMLPATLFTWTLIAVLITLYMG